MIARGQFTNYLLTQLGAFALPVGDNDAPTDPHGWQGEPNEGGTNFIPWLVLAPGGTSQSTDAIGSPQEDWRLPYFVSVAGVSRQQAESVADKARDFFKGLDKKAIVLKAETWRLTYVRATSIGSVTRIAATNPAYHVQTDTVEFWLSKEI